MYRINGETKYIPSRTVCSKFAGQILPKYIFFCRVRHEVFSYIPKVQVCFSCYRVGHICKLCREKPRWIFCSGEAHKSNMNCIEKDNPPHCINCQDNHLATSHECSIIIKHKLVLSLAVSENIPLVDARRKTVQDFLSLLEEY